MVDWLRRAGWLPVAAAAVLVVTGVMILGGKSERTQVLSVYSPEPNATAHTWYSRRPTP